MIIDIRSIQHEAVRIGPASGNAESLPCAIVKRGCLPSAHDDRSRLQESELVITSAIQRQVANRPLVHQRAQRGSIQFHQRRFSGDGDLVGKLSHLEAEVDHR